MKKINISILKKILPSLLILIILQMVIIYGLILLGGAMTKMENNIVSIVKLILIITVIFSIVWIFIVAKLLTRQFAHEKDKGVWVYMINDNGETRCTRIKCFEYDDKILGAVTDITQYMIEKKCMGYNRDYDLLTSLYNRNTFEKECKKIFDSPNKLKVSAMIVMDLDNLKFVNDTYGHDYGDRYIIAAANVLKKFKTKNIIVARLSSDEFVIFIYGCKNKEQARIICDDIKSAIRKTVVAMPDKTMLPLRASAGISWYAEHSTKFDELIRYADFAMYMTKKNQKGEFTEFDMQSYNVNSYLIYCNEELNELLENNQIKYQFQPIIDSKSGDIFAYEALIRPLTLNIKTPKELLELASFQAKLQQVERLTMFEAVRSFRKKTVFNSNTKLFINSISNKILTDDEVKEFEIENGDILPRLVIELTETERQEEGIINKKKGIVLGWGASIALDDFGVGYNGESLLLELNPQYVKIDSSIVRGLHNDMDRVHVVKNILSYCQKREIKVIAEGIEQHEEMETAIKIGVDYLQGYYLAIPSDDPPANIIEIKKQILETNNA